MKFFGSAPKRNFVDWRAMCQFLAIFGKNMEGLLNGYAKNDENDGGGFYDVEPAPSITSTSPSGARFCRPHNQNYAQQPKRINVARYPT